MRESLTTVANSKETNAVPGDVVGKLRKTSPLPNDPKPLAVLSAGLFHLLSSLIEEGHQ